MAKRPPEIIEGSYRVEDRPMGRQPIFNHPRIWFWPLAIFLLIRIALVLAAHHPG